MTPTSTHLAAAGNIIAPELQAQEKQQPSVDLSDALNKILSVIEQQLLNAGELSNVEEKSNRFNDISELLALASDVSKAIANPALAKNINMTAIAAIISDEQQDISPAEKQAKERMNYIATQVELQEQAEIDAKKEAKIETVNDVNSLPEDMQQLFMPEIQQTQQLTASDAMRLEVAGLLDTSTNVNEDITKLAVSTAFTALNSEHQQLIADTLGVAIEHIAEQALISRLERLQSEGMFSVASLTEAHQHVKEATAQPDIIVLAQELLAYEALNLNIQVASSVILEHVTQLNQEIQQYRENGQNFTIAEPSVDNVAKPVVPEAQPITIPDAIAPKNLQDLYNQRSAEPAQPDMTLQAGQAKDMQLQGRLAEQPQLTLGGANSSAN